jgi:hypothetical protein
MHYSQFNIFNAESPNIYINGVNTPYQRLSFDTIFRSPEGKLHDNNQANSRLPKQVAQ